MFANDKLLVALLNLKFPFFALYSHNVRWNPTQFGNITTATGFLRHTMVMYWKMALVDEMVGIILVVCY